MRRSVELQTITKAITKMVPRPGAARVSVAVTHNYSEAGKPAHATWTGTPDDLALQIVTRLYGRPGTAPEMSPLAQAEDAKRRRDIDGELAALARGHADLMTAPWYPARPGDLVHVRYEQVGDFPAFGETYIVGDAGDCLRSLQLLTHTCSLMDDELEGSVGCFASEASDEPLHEAWFEAGPHRLTIVRDGQVVHDGARRKQETAAARVLFAAERHAATMREVQRYLERGEPELALARLKSGEALPPCGAPGFTPEQADCPRPRGHRGACSDNADYVEPPHECPALPEQLHAVVTVGAKVEGVHFAGLYADRDAAADHAAGYQAFAEGLNDRYVQPAPGAPGEMVLELPQENERTAYGVQLAVVVPLQVLPDPREADWQHEQAAAADPQDLADYGKDLDDEDDYDERDGEE